MTFGVSTMKTQKANVFIKGNYPYGASFRDFRKDLNYSIDYF